MITAGQYFYKHARNCVSFRQICYLIHHISNIVVAKMDKTLMELLPILEFRLSQVHKYIKVDLAHRLISRKLRKMTMNLTPVFA